MLQFAAMIVFAKVLGSEAQGILSIFRSTGQIIVAVIWFGLPASIVYFVGKDKRHFKQLLKNCFKWFLAAFLILVVTLLILPNYWIPQINLLDKYTPFLLIFIFLLALFDLFQGLTLSLKKYLYYNLFTFGLGVIIFLGSMLTSFVPHGADKLTIAIGCYITGYVILFVYGLILNWVEWNKSNGRILTKLKFFDQLRVGFRGYISTLTALLLFRVDIFLVGYFLSFKEAGRYSIALFGAELVVKIPYWSAGILTPMVASAEDGYVRKTVYLFYTSILLAGILGILITLAIKLFPTFISNIIGRDFAGVEICLIFLMPRVIMQSGVGILAANLAGKGYPWYHPVGCIIPLFLVIILDTIFVPRFGIVGAALGNSLAYISAVIIFGIGFYKYNYITEDVCLKDYWATIRGYMGGRLPGS